MARMIEALALEGHENVLEVGTGLGYQAAILSRLAKFVFTMELRADLVADAALRLARCGITNVRVLQGDGTVGCPSGAPFDAVVVAAGYREVPAPIVDQLAVNGRVVQPIDVGDFDEVTLFQKEVSGRLRRIKRVRRARFVPLYGRHGFGQTADHPT
jgi:protein-L-isoaspartate(D-aspartate) O-methyltransferase